MVFALTEEQGMIRDMAQNFADEKIQPFANEWDAEKHFPVDMMREGAELGFGGIYSPEECGGTGLSRLDAVLIFEQLSRACPSTAAFISIHNMVTWMLTSFGSDFLKEKYGADMTAMNLIGSYC